MGLLLLVEVAALVGAEVAILVLWGRFVSAVGDGEHGALTVFLSQWRHQSTSIASIVRAGKSLCPENTGIVLYYSRPRPYRSLGSIAAFGQYDLCQMRSRSPPPPIAPPPRSHPVTRASQHPGHAAADAFYMERTLGREKQPRRARAPTAGTHGPSHAPPRSPSAPAASAPALLPSFALRPSAALALRPGPDAARRPQCTSAPASHRPAPGTSCPTRPSPGRPPRSPRRRSPAKLSAQLVCCIRVCAANPRRAALSPCRQTCRRVCRLSSPSRPANLCTDECRARPAQRCIQCMAKRYRDCIHRTVPSAVKLTVASHPPANPPPVRYHVRTRASHKDACPGQPYRAFEKKKPPCQRNRTARRTKRSKGLSRRSDHE